MTYIRQTSTIGGKILAIFLSGIFLIVTAVMTGPVALFGFLLYSGNMIALLFWVLGNAWKKRRQRRAGEPVSDEVPYLQVRSGLGSAYLSGFIVAVPLSLVVLVTSHILAPTKVGWLIAAAMKDTSSGLPAQVYVAAALILVIDLAFVGWGFYHSFVAASPDAFKGTGEVEEKGIPMALLVLCTQLFFVTLCIAAPIATLLIGILGLKGPWIVPAVTKAFYVLACGPAMGFGAALVARGMWMHHLMLQVRNLATSDIRSAAAGLVEMQGTVRHVDALPDDQPVFHSRRHLPEPVFISRPFFLENDDGSRVRIDLPGLDQHAAEGVMVLEKGVSGRGEYREQRLMPGDRVYVIGEFAPGTSDGPPVLAPWHPPRAGLAMSGLNAFLDRAVLGIGQDAAEIFPVGKIVEQALGIQFLKGLFLVTDSDERGDVRMLFRHWRRSVAIGYWQMVGAGALLALVLSGLARHFL